MKGPVLLVLSNGESIEIHLNGGESSAIVSLELATQFLNALDRAILTARAVRAARRMNERKVKRNA